MGFTQASIKSSCTTINMQKIMESHMQVLASYSDPLSRQASEAIHISKMNCEILNGKSEFHQPSIVDVKRSIRWGL